MHHINKYLSQFNEYLKWNGCGGGDSEGETKYQVVVVGMVSSHSTHSWPLLEMGKRKLSPAEWSWWWLGLGQDMWMSRCARGRHVPCDPTRHVPCDHTLESRSLCYSQILTNRKYETMNERDKKNEFILSSIVQIVITNIWLLVKHSYKIINPYEIKDIRCESIIFESAYLSLFIYVFLDTCYKQKWKEKKIFCGVKT